MKPQHLFTNAVSQMKTPKPVTGPVTSALSYGVRASRVPVCVHDLTVYLDQSSVAAPPPQSLAGAATTAASPTTAEAGAAAAGGAEADQSPASAMDQLGVLPWMGTAATGMLSLAH